MAKKFGKFLLFTAAIASAVAAVYYCVHKKKAEQDNIEEEDYDDFSDDKKEEDSDTSRSYVPLNPETPSEDAGKTEGAEEAQNAPVSQECSDEEPKAQEGFTPLAENVAQEAADETVEEFFDEEDTTEEEPPINDN